MAGSHEITPEVHNGVSTLDEPSAAWGWHHLGRHAVQLSGWTTVFILLAYNFGNHTGHVETFYLFTFAALIAVGLLWQIFEPQGKQTRTLTARNKPLGYEEPDWAYLQATVSGPYAQLKDSELRALNIEPSRVAHLRALDN
ncbi:DUF2631 domain-containing protein [Corynebacterium sp. ES2794-CONJ1]|uniref:DUF2631 domain-containing protein n=1 Tax=unclassified Corynebacterium TaxID=2624378 RepID=UPI00216A5073|nr:MULTISPECIES: DUF2631 domain-containing protein [unclassified Corynebacterium]MCS4490913.1 DUF2631 domain-containing protein [Corynebacterium sp. ES2715-CONJ3]MCU9518573.1 DUF2631 domain-containing protein [Corynebacterium sp. ES2794-CONJ1]